MSWFLVVLSTAYFVCADARILSMLFPNPLVYHKLHMCLDFLLYVLSSCTDCHTCQSTKLFLNRFWLLLFEHYDFSTYAVCVPPVASSPPLLRSLLRCVMISCLSAYQLMCTTSSVNSSTWQTL